MFCDSYKTFVMLDNVSCFTDRHALEKKPTIESKKTGTFYLSQLVTRLDGRKITFQFTTFPTPTLTGGFVRNNWKAPDLCSSTKYWITYFFHVLQNVFSQSLYHTRVHRPRGRKKNPLFRWRAFFLLQLPCALIRSNISRQWVSWKPECSSTLCKRHV